MLHWHLTNTAVIHATYITPSQAGPIVLACNLV